MNIDTASTLYMWMPSGIVRVCVCSVGHADCHKLHKKDLKLFEEESQRRIVSFVRYMSLHLRKELKDKAIIINHH